MSWTIDWAGDAIPFSQLGLCRLRRTRLNQGRDTVTFRRSAAEVLAIPPAATVRIRRGGELWFSGVAVAAPAVDASADGEAQDYRIEGPWWHLESIIYQQPWQVAADPEDGESVLVSVWKSHLILGQGTQGERLSMRQQLEQILDYAISAGAPLTYAIGGDTLDSIFPLDECRDLSCAEAIQRLLRWDPPCAPASTTAKMFPFFSLPTGPPPHFSPSPSAAPSSHSPLPRGRSCSCAPSPSSTSARTGAAAASGGPWPWTATQPMRRSGSPRCSCSRWSWKGLGVSI